MSLYVGETMLREVTADALRQRAPSVLEVRIVRTPGPFRLRNWSVEWINVLVEDYGRARDEADVLEMEDRWIMVPDEHDLVGQVYGKEGAPLR